MRRRGPEPMRRRGPEPMRRRGPEPMRRRSPEPMRRRSPQPMRRRSPEPMRRRLPRPLQRHLQRRETETMIARSSRLALTSFATLAFALAAGGVQADPAPEAAGPTPVVLPPPPPGKGEVVFFRKPLFSLVPFNWHVHEGDKAVCPMQAAAYCVAMVTPGDHTYEVHTEVKNELKLEVDEGETYYVIGGISMGVVVNHPTIAPAEKAQFDALSAKLKELPATDPDERAAPAAAPAPAPPAS
jgi:hypothetical protein